MLEKLKAKIEPLLGKKGSKPSLGLEGQEDDTVIAIEPKSILRRQILRLTLLILVGLVVVILVINIAININSPPRKKPGNKQNIAGQGALEELKIEVASKSLDPEKMWRNHFEDKLLENESKVKEQLLLIDESLLKKEQEIESRTRADLEVMRQQLEFAKQELQEAAHELKLMREQQLMDRQNNRDRNSDKDLFDQGIITSRLIDNELEIARPKSRRYFIPETAYVSGVLLGGISVSTGAFAASEPTPVIIRVAGRGNLPKNFDVDLKTCRILGSSYGDLPSERAIIRAEVMSCTDQKSEEIITTKIAGIAFGDDGVNGIKGRVVQTSGKQLQHAFLGSVLSGFAGAAKSGEQFSITGAGAINTKQSPFGDRLKDSTLTGFGSAGEKLADYYLKQAENMSPVLQIPAGSRVDVVFTKGVYLGSMDVARSIERERRLGSKANTNTNSKVETNSNSNSQGGDDRW